MNITGLDGIVYGVEELDRCIEFWDDFGLNKREASADGARFTTADGGTTTEKSPESC